MRKLHQVCLSILLISLAVSAASAQSFRVQCPIGTVTLTFLHEYTRFENNARDYPPRGGD